MFPTLVTALSLSSFALAEKWYSEASTTEAATTYACNPAHDYGNGASCIETDGTLSLVLPTSSEDSVSTSCTTEVVYASTTEAPMTTYACNPAHDYGNGASCIETDGSLTLALPSTSTQASMTTYACNPAHSYPEGASCIETGSSLTLVYPSTSSEVSASTTCTDNMTTSATPSPMTTAYACNPAHSYPEGASCIETGGSLTLVYPSISSKETTCTDDATSASTTMAPPMTTRACNPAHDYGNGETCVFTNGSLTLLTPSSTWMYTSSVPHHANASSARMTSSVPAMTTYACNPAHFYPNCATCSNVSGTLSLITPSGGCYVNKSMAATPYSDVYTTKVVTAYTTYCPSATSFSTHGQTYTVTTATTLTICPGDCTVSAPLSSKTSSSMAMTSSVASSTTSMESTTPCPESSATSSESMTVSSGSVATSTKSIATSSGSMSSATVPTTMPMGTTTAVLTAYTTYCPSATVVTVGTESYTVTKATTLTVSGPITVTSYISQPPVYSSEMKSSASSAMSSPMVPANSALTSTLTAKTTQYSTVVVNSQLTKTYPAASSSSVVVMSSESYAPSSIATPASSPATSVASAMSAPSSPVTSVKTSVPVYSAASSSMSSVKSSMPVYGAASSSRASIESSMPAYSAPASSSASSVYNAPPYSAPAGWAPAVTPSNNSISKATPYTSATSKASSSHGKPTASGTPMVAGAAQPMATGGVMVGAMVLLALL